MILADIFSMNILLCQVKSPETGCIVEAGVWRGGMSAGMSDAKPGRLHYLFDSFDGLPPAKEIDGPAALQWQQNVDASNYYDNCRAEQSFAQQAMSMAHAKEFRLIKGWFSETMPNFILDEPIAILRLDADWYESTLQCLEALYPHVMDQGLIILDDYYTWDGCSRALHDYLAARKSCDRIHQWMGGVCYLTKTLATS
jgi:O-methyltransferase